MTITGGRRRKVGDTIQAVKESAAALAMVVSGYQRWQWMKQWGPGPAR